MEWYECECGDWMTIDDTVEDPSMVQCSDCEAIGRWELAQEEDEYQEWTEYATV